MARKKQIIKANDLLADENLDLVGQVHNLRADLKTANQRLEATLAITRHGAANLALVFGGLTDLGHGEDDTYLYYDATNGFAHLAVNPAIGAIRVSDPGDVVAPITVSFNTEGELDEYAQRLIHTFLASVMFARTAGVQAISGPVSLKVRRP